jgi:hypothetical protein
LPADSPEIDRFGRGAHGSMPQASVEAWNWLLAETGRIRSLCSYPWLEQVSS